MKPHTCETRPNPGEYVNTSDNEVLHMFNLHFVIVPKTATHHGTDTAVHRLGCIVDNKQSIKL